MLDPAKLLQRLNKYCAKALESAAALCQTRAHSEITIEHWLLKLLEQGNGDITVIMRYYQLDVDKIWQGLLTYLDSLPHTVQQKPTLSAPLVAVLQSAWLKASLEEQEETIRSVHLLQALQDTPYSLKATESWELLTLSPVSLTRLRAKLDDISEENPELQILQTDLSTETINAQKPSTELKDKKAIDTNNELQKQHQAVLEKFTVDITENAKQNKIDPVFARDNEIRQMVDILSRRRKNNPILVGDPGVGKTALVEGLALRIAEGNVPDSLKNVTILTLDLGLLQAGAGVKGEFEQRLKNVINAVQQSATPILLFIDEAHTIIGAGNQAGGADAANLLKPALARGELRTIAATTWSEYKQYFERDAALERRFQIVKVEEPNDDDASLMLRGLTSRYTKYHGVHILDEAVVAAVSLSRRYISGRQLPDKAVDLLDTASARVRMSLDTNPEAIILINSELEALDLEKQSLLHDKELGENEHKQRLDEIAEKVKDLNIHLEELQAKYSKEQELTNKLIELRTQLNNDENSDETETLKQLHKVKQELIQVQENNPLISLDVNARMVATVVADWTGVPLESLMKDEQSHLLDLETNLQTRIVGQDAAIHAISQRIRAAKAGLTNEQAPLGVFLLNGPSGVGKTETALALADILFGGEQSLITINMSEYQESHTVSQLKGSPPGYVGYGEGGILTEAVRKKPYSVVLLDEIEKAHKDILNLFYQVFDRGFMRDGEGREIDFTNTLILMTSNLGSEQLMALFDEMPDAPLATQHELLRPIIKEHFQPALLARFQTVIYQPLSADALYKIIMMKLDKVVNRLKQHYAIDFIVGEALYQQLVQACLLPDTGARNIDSILNQQILPVLANILLQKKPNDKDLHSLKLDFTEEEGIILDWITDNQKATDTDVTKKSKPSKKNTKIKNKK